MSVEAPKTVEETPIVDTQKALPEQPEVAAPTESTEPITAPAVAEETAPVAATTEEPKKDETVVDAVPASEGVLGYKEPGFFKKFIFTKHHFWFSEDASAPESLTAFLRSEKAEAKHSSAAWARETGKGLLFYTKRHEDKATPAGVINLSDASAVTKEGFNQFSFKVGSTLHRFEATTAKERDSWIVAVEKAIEEAKELKDDILGRESYKKNVEEYSKPLFAPVAAAKTPRSKSKEPKKSLDASTATAAAAAAAPVPETTTTEAEEPVKPKTERSQSRKRGSIFGSLLNKKEEHSEKKEEKVEAKKEVQEEKKVEAEAKKEEAREAGEPAKAAEAAEAAAIAAVPAAIVTSTDKKEEKDEVSPTEKKNKRGSVFGSLFKNRVTSPSTEKSEHEALKESDVPPVSETAPKIDEPIENKPIDTAAVTAPVDAVETPAATEEPAKDITPATESSAAHKSDKKGGGLLGFIKKTEAKLEGKKETKEEAKAEKPVEPIAAEAAEPTPLDVATETPAAAAAASEERPARDNKRRTSLFFNKKDKDASEAEDTVAEPKREKSPLPGGKFIGQLVRRASKAIKSEGPKEKSAAESTTATEATATEETPAAAVEATEAHAVEPVAATEPIQSAPEPVATTSPEVKATA